MKPIPNLAREDDRLLRCRDAVKLAKVPLHEFEKVVEAGVLPRKQLKPNGRGWYWESDVLRVFRTK